MRWAVSTKKFYKYVKVLWGVELVLYYVFYTTIPLRGSPKMVTALQVWQWSGGESGLDCDDSGLDLHSTD